MKNAYLLFLLALLLDSAKGVCASPGHGADSSSAAPFCKDTLWNHVYHSYRLVINDSCMSVTGTVEDCYSEEDGDYHIRLKVDTQYSYLLNADNLSDEDGDLVCEPICAATITQSDAVQPCEGMVNTVFIPNIGEYVKITGPYVTDNDHGWNELHPVTSIVIVTASAVNSIAAENLALKLFPNPANQEITFSLSGYPDEPVQIILNDAIGRSAGQYQMLNTLQLKVNVDWFPAGVYYYTMMQKGKVIRTGSFEVAH